MIRKTIQKPIGDAVLDAELLYGQDVIDTLKEIPAQSVDTICTSPPYWGLRNYGVKGQMGLEAKLSDYVSKMVRIFGELKRVLKTNGTVWLNLGDTYYPHHGSRGNVSGGGDTLRGQDNGYQPAPKLDNGGYLKSKDLVGVPWRVAFALQEAGWYLRSDIIWNKPSPMPSSVRDRPTRSHEFVFLLSHPEGRGLYYYDMDATLEEGHKKSHDGDSAKRRARTVWDVNPSRFVGSHCATWPEKLVEKMVRATCPKGGVVMDIFSGSATTGVVAWQLGCNYVGIDLNEEYYAIAESRLLGRKFTSKKKKTEVGDALGFFSQ